MKTQIRILLAILFMMFVVFVGQSSAQDMDRWIVTIKGPAEQAVLRAGGIVDHVFELIPAIAIRIPEAALPGLVRNPAVVSIEPDVVVTALPKPDTPPGQDKKPPDNGEEEPPPSQQLPWGVDRIDAEWAWDTVTGAGAKVAVLDTGIDYKHPDLDDNCYGGVNVINPRKDYKDDNGHGTHVAGIIAAEDNDIGVVGVAPGAYLYGVKALDRNGSGWLSDIIAGLEWCVNNGMDIVNMSLGTNSDIQALHDACDAASAKVILVAAAGNDGGAVDYPAAYNSVIAVSATNISDGLAYFSSYGPEIEIAAPGVNILSTYKGGGYETHSGTSMAAPHVAGTLTLSANIFATADDLGLPPEQQGAGLVDAGEAATGTVDYGNDLP
ncbi:MAG: S8 family peptidase [Planctomycetota bacterium]|jgi:subtilisin family serine protease